MVTVNGQCPTLSLTINCNEQGVILIDVYTRRDGNDREGKKIENPSDVVSVLFQVIGSDRYVYSYQIWEFGWGPDGPRGSGIT